jgi:poly-gamma-glutamate synthesis protein (capsule biosynthesis protein)
VIVEREGFRVALIAVTDIWNQGPLRLHAARDVVADADPGELVAAVRAARADPTIDAVLVSYHGGDEYLELPLTRARTMARAAIDAGADAFLGHHPHVLQGVEIRAGRPIFYSLGNFLFGVNIKHPETGLGMLARLRLRRGGAPGIEVCPFRIVGLTAIPLAGDPRRAASEALFAQRLRRVNAFLAGAPALGPFGDDGCAPLGR